MNKEISIEEYTFPKDELGLRRNFLMVTQDIYHIFADDDFDEILELKEDDLLKNFDAFLKNKLNTIVHVNDTFDKIGDYGYVLLK